MLCILFSILLTCVLPSEIKLAGLYFLDSKLQIPVGNLVIPPGSEEFALGILAETRAKGDRNMWIQRDQGRGNTSVDAGEGWILLVDLIL